MGIRVSGVADVVGGMCHRIVALGINKGLILQV